MTMAPTPDVYPVPPTEQQAKGISEVRSAIQFAILSVDTYCPPSRERSLAQTKLEEACMWAVKSITHGVKP